MFADLDPARAIFGYPKSPARVWERQFDHRDEDLRKIARKAPEEITAGDLWYYLHDLAYMELQPDLFQYLFPVCLAFWSDTLMRSESASSGDAEFHYALLHGQILRKMLTYTQYRGVLQFFVDRFCSRLERERGFVYDGSRTPAYGWIFRFSSLGYVAPVIGPIWDSWWRLDHPGKAVSAVMWASGLLYPEGENPIFGAWTPNGGGGGPCLWECDASIYDAGWLPENVAALEGVLTAPYVVEKLREAASILQDEPEAELAAWVAADAAEPTGILTERIGKLITRLAEPPYVGDWDD